MQQSHAAQEYGRGKEIDGQNRRGNEFIWRVSCHLFQGLRPEASGCILARELRKIVRQSDPCSTMRPVLHDHDAVAQGTYQGQVVGDEHVGQAEAGLQVAQQLHDLELDRAVQGRGGLVQDDELRPQDKGPGDGDALALAARELVG